NTVWPAREKLRCFTTSKNVVSWSKSMAKALIITANPGEYFRNEESLPEHRPNAVSGTIHTFDSLDCLFAGSVRARCATVFSGRAAAIPYNAVLFSRKIRLARSMA
ncbi:MAG TPA: hypothetical protein VEG63_11660, partial [Candidatus Acidoferrales bacterium]|nr:hypothetical protein [Candidatus Acidoferrales bacterium]